MPYDISCDVGVLAEVRFGAGRFDAVRFRGRRFYARREFSDLHRWVSG